MARRGRLVLLLLSLIFIIILCNLFLLMYDNPADIVASSQSKWTIHVGETRGTIYDRNLSPLVNDEEQLRAACAPNVEELVALKEIVSPNDYAYAVKCVQKGTPFVVSVKRSIGSTAGILTLSTPNRYAQKQLAAHIIGYCRDGIGVSGIESACEKQLSLYNGSMSIAFETNGRGQQMSGVTPLITDSTARSAGGVVLTIDRHIQSALQEVTDSTLSKGAVIILDPYSGDVLACASYPSYHPNAVSAALEQNDGALINRALSLYDCGSVFKIITAAAALESGVDADRKYICNGHLDVSGTLFHCHNRSGHGELTMEEAFAVSCNTYFIQLAQDIGADALFSMANTLGFGKKITLAEGMATPYPLLPSRESLEQPAALANFSFGQGYLMTSPLHIAQIVATVANGGKMPSVQLLHMYIDENGTGVSVAPASSYTVLSNKSAKILQKMLVGVVENGTGITARPNSVSAAGKTGTAETGQRNGETAVVQSWFAGYLPAENPQYIIVVLAEDSASTKENASSIFCEISNNLFELGVVGNKETG